MSFNSFYLNVPVSVHTSEGLPAMAGFIKNEDEVPVYCCEKRVVFKMKCL